MYIPPHGYEEIKKFYGWDDAYLGEDGLPKPGSNWQRNLIPLILPAPIKLSWAETVVTKVQIHEACEAPFNEFLQAVHQNNLYQYLSPYAGSYAFRLKRSNHQLSMHSFGAAMDFNPQHNPMQKGIVSQWEIGPKPFSMPLKIVEIARECGLKWGGDFDDPMHFQFGTGY